MKPLFLQIPLTDAIKLPPYSKYMKYIVTNKIKVPNEAISTMLANYSFSVKNNYVRTALCDLGAGVSVIPFSLYKRLCLDKLIPTDISLQMANKSTTIPNGICEDVPVEVSNFLILTDFVVLDMPEDGRMSIILGRHFLIPQVLLLISIKERSLSMLMTRSTRLVFQRRSIRHGLNSIEKFETVKIGDCDCPL